MEMTTINNRGDVRNQVGGSQTVGGSIYSGDVHYSSHYHTGSLPSTQEEKLRLIHKDILRSLAFPKMLDRRTEVEQPHANTCRWILQHKDYVNWASQTRGLLWIKGKPGAGKSTVMSFLYNNLQERKPAKDGIQLNFFFNARATELQRSYLGMLRSLLNQLFRKDLSVQPMVVKLYNDKSSAFGGVIGEARGWEWQLQELEGLFSRVIIDSAQRQQLTVFIDALDEAGETRARQIAEYFHSINDQVAERCGSDTNVLIRICISSRHYPIASSVSGIEISVEDYNGLDIKDYVHDRLNIASRHLDDSEMQEWRKLEHEIVLKSQNIFQWVRLVVPLLERSLDEAEPMSQVSQWLNQVPQELGDVYEYIIRNIISQRNRSQAYRLFLWVCLAERPLSTVEMQSALETDLAAMPTVTARSTHVSSSVMERHAKKLQTRVKALSGGLAEVVSHPKDPDKLAKYNRRLGHVQIIHQTVNDFFLERGLPLLESLQSGGVEIDIDPDQILRRSQAALYRSCLNYLSLNCSMIETVIDDQDSPRSDVAVASSQFEDDNDWRFLFQFPLAHYASYNILRHATKAGNHREIPLSTEMKILAKVLPAWTAMHKLFDGDRSRQFPHSKADLIHISAVAGLSDMLQSLIDMQVPTDAETEFGYTALHFAAQNGRRGAAETLVNAGANLTKRTSLGQTPFVLAGASNETSLISFLLQKETESNTVAENIDDALLFACKNGRNSAVKVLLQAGANVNGADTGGDTPLRAAIFGKRNVAVVKTLLDSGASVDAADYGASYSIFSFLDLHIGAETATIRNLLVRSKELQNK